MAHFTVQPAALHNLANVLGSPNAAGAALDMKYLIDYYEYAQKYVQLDGPGLLFNGWLKPKIQSIQEQLTNDASLLSTSLIESAIGLDASANTYSKTEREQAAHIDSIFKAGTRTPLEDEQQTTGALADPVANLVTPSDEGGVPDLAQELLDGGGVFSVSDLVLKILRWCGLDIMGWVRDRLAGDPKDLARVGSAVDHLAAFQIDAANVVAEGAATLFKSWSGNAADAASGYFNKESNALSEYAATMGQVPSSISALIVAIQEGMSALEGALTIAIDAAIKAAVSVAAAGCLAEVPGIDVVAAIVGAAEVENVIGKVHKFFDIWNTVWAAHEGILGLIVGLAGGLHSFDVGTKLPTTGYYNASQGKQPWNNDDDGRGSGPGHAR